MRRVFILILNLKTPSVLDLTLNIANVLPCSAPAASHLPSLSCPHSACFGGITRSLAGSSQPSRLACTLPSATLPFAMHPVRSFSLGGGAVAFTRSTAECVHTAKGQGSARGGETHALLEVEELRERSWEASGRVEDKTVQDNEVKVCGGRRERRQQK